MVKKTKLNYSVFQLISKMKITPKTTQITDTRAELAELVKRRAEIAVGINFFVKVFLIRLLFHFEYVAIIEL